MSCSACKKASHNSWGRPEKEGLHGITNIPYQYNRPPENEDSQGITKNSYQYNPMPENEDSQGITKNPYQYNPPLENEDSHGVDENPYLLKPDPEHGNLYGVLNKPSHHTPKQSENVGLSGIGKKVFRHNPKEQENEILDSISDESPHKVPGQPGNGSSCNACHGRSRNFREQRENELPFVASHLNRQHHADSHNLEEFGLGLKTDRHDVGAPNIGWHSNVTTPTAPLPSELPLDLPAPIAPYPTDPGRFTCDGEHDCNRYATKKTIAQGLIDLSLLAANVAQFKHLLTTDDAKWKSARLLLVTTVLALQMIQTCVLVVLGAVFNMNKRLDQKKAEHLNNVSLCLMFAIVVLSGISTGLDSRF